MQTDAKSFSQSLRNVLSSQVQIDSSDDYTSFEKCILDNLIKFSSKNFVSVMVSNSMLCASPKQVK